MFIQSFLGEFYMYTLLHSRKRILLFQYITIVRVRISNEIFCSVILPTQKYSKKDNTNI